MFATHEHDFIWENISQNLDIEFVTPSTTMFSAPALGSEMLPLAVYAANKGGFTLHRFTRPISTTNWKPSEKETLGPSETACRLISRDRFLSDWKLNR